VAVSGCDQNISIETPRSAPLKTVELTFNGGESWVVEFAADEKERPFELQVSCGGRPYATARVGEDVPPHILGADIAEYYRTTCTDGNMELTVFTAEDGWLRDAPGQYVPVTFYFAPGQLRGYAVGTELPPPIIDN
jgi:hypothetical protein